MPNSPKEIAERLVGEVLPCRYDRDPGCRGTAEHGICASCHRRASVAAVIEPLVEALHRVDRHADKHFKGTHDETAAALMVIRGLVAEALAQADGGGDG